MKLILGERRSGKTSQLIYLAAKEQLTIVSDIEDSILQKKAKLLNVSIPKSMSYYDFQHGTFNGGESPKGFLLDNVELFLKKMSGNVPIEGMSISTEINIKN